MILVDKDTLLAKVHEVIFSYKPPRISKGEAEHIVTRFLIEEAPVVDAVEVVRCKDCAWFHLKGDGCPCGYGTCSMIAGEIMSEDFYCSYGRKKDVK